MRRVLPVLFALSAACETEAPAPEEPVAALAPAPEQEAETHPTSSRSVDEDEPLMPKPTDCGPEDFGLEPDPPTPEGSSKVVVHGHFPVVFVRDGERFAPGELEAGWYKVRADFGDGEADAGEVRIPVDGDVVVRCSALRRDCQVSP